MSHWYCKVCRDRKEPEHVTFEENCADCGTEVDWIECEDSGLKSTIIDLNKIQTIGFLDRVKLLFKPMKISVDKSDGVDFSVEFKVMNGKIYIMDCVTHNKG